MLAPWKESYDQPAAAKSLQSCLTLCDPVDGSPPGSPVPRLLQARTLEWVAISFSNAWQWKVKGKLLSHVWFLATPWTVAYQAPPSMGFSRQEYWSGVPLPSPCYLMLQSELICNIWVSNHYFVYLKVTQCYKYVNYTSIKMEKHGITVNVELPLHREKTASQAEHTFMSLVFFPKKVLDVFIQTSLCGILSLK